MKRTLKRILSVVLCVAVLATSVFCMGFVSAETNVNFLMENGKRIGIKDVTIDGVTYYDIDGGKSTIDPDKIGEIDFFKKALTAEYNGYSALELWSNIASLTFESAGAKFGYQNLLFGSFDESFTTNSGEYKVDLIDAFRNTSPFSRSGVMGSGLDYTDSLSNLQPTMASQINTLTNKTSLLTQKNIFKYCTGSEDGFEALNNNATQIVLYNIVSVYDYGGDSKDESFSSFGLAFYDFEVTPLIDEDLNYITAAEGYDSIEEASAASAPGVTYNNTTDGMPYTSFINNPSSSESNVSASYSESVTTSVSNSIQSSESYSFGVSLNRSVEMEASFGDVFKAKTSVAKGISTQKAIETAYGEEKSISNTTTTSTSTDVVLPAHSKLAITQTSGTSEISLNYDCPVYLTYKVAIFGMNGGVNVSGTNELDQKNYDQGGMCTLFGTDNSIGGFSATDNLYKRAIENAGSSGFEGAQGQVSGYWENHDDGDPAESYKGVNWNSFIDATQANGTASARTCIEHLKNSIPLSATGATITTLSESVVTDITGIFPLYNLYSVKPVDNTIYTLTAGNSLDLGKIATAGFNAFNVPYYGYISNGGKWTFCNSSGNTLESVDGASITDLSNTQHFNAEEEGTYYLKFLIDENLYTNVNDSSIKIKNSDLSSLPIIKIKVNAAADGPHDCVAGDWKTSFPATCSAEGEKCNYCVTCGKLMEVQAVAKLAHTEVETVTPATCQSEGSAKTVCGSCSTVISSRVIPKTEHTLGVWAVVSNATCIADGEKQQCCSSCGNVINSEVIPAHGHTDGGWKVDFEATADHNGQMSRYCTTCDAVLDTKEFTTHTHEFGYESITREPTCTQNGEKGLFCSICNAMYATEQIEKSGHGANVAVISIQPTCTTAGEEKLYCADCGMLTGANEIPAKGHGETYEAVASEATTDRNGIIETRCKDCDAVISTEEFGIHTHEFGYESITREPTCTQNGEKGLFCSICNAMYATEQIEKSGHGANVAVISIQPTCTTAGEEKLYCADCGMLTGANEIPSLGHDDGVWTVSIKATCEDKGEEICMCTRCGEEIDSRATDVLGHDNGVWKIDFEATADHEGQMTKYCTRCDMSLESKTFELHAHSEGYRKVVTPATCTTEGEGGIFCASCGVQYGSYAINSIGHDYSAWHMNNNGTHSRSCSRCGNTEINNCEYTSSVTAPACTESGITTHVCDICAYSYTDAYTAALGHDWSAYTECADGENHCRECEKCSATETSAHNWSEWSSNDDSSLFENGTETRKCADCGASETQEQSNTSWISEIFRPIIVFFGNIVHKLIYIVSLNWLFPELTITA